MSFRVGLLLVTLLVGSIAFPLQDDVQDMSIFFDHTDPSARIIGGTTAGHVPYMVALTSGLQTRSLICGGSLATTRHVLTAAHCIVQSINSNGQMISSLRGYVDTNRFASGGTPYSFNRYIIHPDFDYPTIKNDIGLLVTSTNVALSSRVALAALNFDFVNAGVPTTVTGWGVTESTPNSPVLLRLNGAVIDGNRCVTVVAQRAFEIFGPGVPPVDPRTEICSFNSQSGRRGVCNGDSGSPLMRSDRNQQIGLVAWGLPCAHGVPDMFTRLSAFRSWILQNTS